MLSVVTATRAKTPATKPATHAPTAQPSSERLPEACAVFEELGDAVALIDRRARALRWVSAAWIAQLPDLIAGSSLQSVEQVLPGLVAARCDSASSVNKWRSCLGEAQQWDAQIAAIDPQYLLLRVADRREQGRAMQRQLDDREQLLFTSRVISVGEMASTLAHELNQPIGATANLLRGLRSRLARRGVSLSGEESTALTHALDQVMFASRVIARIREFTHSRQPRHTRVDLVALLRSSAALLDWDMQRSGVQLTLELPSAGVQVSGDEVILQQVVVNLMRNALDALRIDPPHDPQLALRLVARPKEIEVQVCDNGCGLDDEAVAKLFVPFASTKPSGMGVGLSICRSFVELHQGRLWFSRNADRGATFHLSLPSLSANTNNAFQ